MRLFSFILNASLNNIINLILYDTFDHLYYYVTFSFFGKLFTPILNNRLCEFIDDYNIINKNQAGFRKRYSTRKYLFMYTFWVIEN
jgi:hypothetical protein